MDEEDIVSRLHRISALLSQKARMDSKIKKINMGKSDHVPIYAKPVKRKLPASTGKKEAKPTKTAAKPKKIKKTTKKTIKPSKKAPKRKPTNLELAELQATKQALERVIRATKMPKRYLSQEAQTNRALLLNSDEAKRTTLDRHVTFLENKDSRIKKKFFLVWENRWYRQSMQKMKEVIRERMNARKYTFAKTQSRKKKPEVGPEMKDIESSSSDGPPIYDDGEVQFSFSDSGTAPDPVPETSPITEVTTVIEERPPQTPAEVETQEIKEDEDVNEPDEEVAVIESGTPSSEEKFTISDFEKPVEKDDSGFSEGRLFESSGQAEKENVQVKTFPAEEEKKKEEVKAKTTERRVQMIIPEFYHRQKEEQVREAKKREASKFSFDSIPTVEPEGDQGEEKQDITNDANDEHVGSFGSDVVFESSDILAKIGDGKSNSFVGSFSDDLDLGSISQGTLTANGSEPLSDSLSFEIDSPK